MPLGASDARKRQLCFSVVSDNVFLCAKANQGNCLKSMKTGVVHLKRMRCKGTRKFCLISTTRRGNHPGIMVEQGNRPFASLMPLALSSCGDVSFRKVLGPPLPDPLKSQNPGVRLRPDCSCTKSMICTCFQETIWPLHARRH